MQLLGRAAIEIEQTKLNKTKWEETMKKIFTLISATLAAVGISLTMIPTNAAAEDKYPSQPLQIIVPLPPGGALDVFVRGLGKEFTARTGAPVVVINRPGANTMVAASACKNSLPDGYHICFLTRSTISINPIFYKSLSYAPLKDFEPIVNAFFGQQILILNKSVPVHSFAEFVKYTKEHPDKLNYASMGVGGDFELLVEWLKHVSGAKVTHIPYKGFPDAMLAFKADRVQLIALLVGNPDLARQVRDGEVKGLLLPGSKRSNLVPSVPTFAQAGLPGYDFELTPWFGFFAPKGTPHQYIATLNKEINLIIADKKFQEKYLTIRGFTPAPSTPEAFAKFLREDREAAARYVKMSGVKLGH